MSKYVDELENALVELDKKLSVNLVNKILNENIVEIHDTVDAVTKALNRIGDLYQEEEYYLAELVYAGDLAKQILDLLKPHMVSKSTSGDSRKLVIIGTVRGDMHDLGKNLVQAFAEGSRCARLSNFPQAASKPSALSPPNWGSSRNRCSIIWPRTATHSMPSPKKYRTPAFRPKIGSRRHT